MADRNDSWRERRAAIDEILRHDVVHSQAELLKKLRRRGFRVTQPSVSRDLQELQVIKANGRYLPGDALPGGDPAPAALDTVVEFVLSCAPAGPYMLVVKTPPGAAAAVASAIDHAGWPEIVGTVAGDDTVFIATPGRRQQARLQAALLRTLAESAHA
jgi:transcriptional regulator of arginine metabolism